MSAIAPAPSVRTNVLANFAGRAWTAVMRLIFIPLYVHYLGVEAFALVGVYSTLTAVLLVLDLGLSAMLTREMARPRTTEEEEQEARDVARTLEFLYWIVGALTGLLLALAAPYIAGSWLNPAGVSSSEVRLALIAMAACVGLQWPASLYTGGLLGLQRHAGLNLITAAGVTVQSAGAVAVLAFIRPTINAYFVWQILATAFLAAALGWYFHRCLLRPGQRAHIRMAVLKTRWKFARGMSGITITSAVLTQTDKIILSRTLPLVQFGYYTVASTVAAALAYLVAPVFTAAYPRLVNLAGSHDEDGVSRLYHSASQLVSVLIVPAALILIAFPHELLRVYLKDAHVAREAAPLLALLGAGLALNSLMTMPFALQLAYGWTSLSLGKNIIAASLYVPLMLGLIARYGVRGAASAFIILNAAYIVAEVPLMHRRLLRGEIGRWYLADTLAPALAAGVVVLVARLFIERVPAALILPYLIATGVLMMIAAALTARRPLESALAAVRSRS